MRLSYSLLALLSIVFSSCGQEKNQIIFDEAANQEILYGVATVEVFANLPFSQWYLSEYEQYTLSPEVLDSLNFNLNDISIKVVLGTWCPDSRREFPRFMKVLTQLEFPLERLTIIGVNRSKISPEAGVNEGFVDFVPTFIVYKDGVEIGRIIESPVKSLELDFYSIVSEK